MRSRQHQYRTKLNWVGQANTVFSERVLDQSFMVEIDGKPSLAGSADPNFGGDATRWNPEDMLLAALSSCHHLWFMFLCSRSGITVATYEDQAEGVLAMNPDGSGEFVQVTLCPKVVVAVGSDLGRAEALHKMAHEKCFIARSVNFPVLHRPTFETVAI